ncbi:MAG: ATP-binding protein [Vicinamibacterales bacterium]
MASRSLFDHLLEGVQIVDARRRYVYVNATAARQGQRRPADLVGRHMAECYPGIEQTPVYAAIGRVLGTGRRESLAFEFTLPDGERRWFDTTVIPVDEGVCLLSLDATQLRRAELDLHFAQRMEALGQLAGGVAHDFNNQLTAVLGFTELLLETETDPDRRTELAAVHDAALRSASLTRQLLAYGRRQVLRIEPLDLNIVVRRMEPLFRRAAGAHIDLDLRLHDRPTVIRGDAQQLENALTNLAVNAVDAMPAGGRLVMATSVADLSDEDVEQRASMQPGRYAVLSVADTGHGMDEATRARVFEPFFTTKPPGKGTGLGLPTVYGIVKQMGGFIWVYSEPGHGTTFRLYFPATADTLRPLSSAEAATPRQAKPSSTVLVVDDDAGVRQLTVRVLVERGYRVLEAADAATARQLATGDEQQLDLLLTDVMLPHGSGPALARELSSRHPGTRVLFMSGYAEGVVQQVGPTDRLLQKPFTMTDLLKAVEAAID